MSWLSEKFAAHNACLVADTYTSAWCGSMKYLDENDFLKSMVEGYSRIYLNIGVDQMLAIVKEMIKKYDVEGVVMHSNRSCKPYSLGQLVIKQELTRRTGLAFLGNEAASGTEIIARGRKMRSGPLTRLSNCISRNSVIS